jgi:hypothetical protein
MVRGYETRRHEATQQTGISVILLTLNWKTPGSNLGRCTVYPEFFRDFQWTYQANSTDYFD